MSKPVWTEGPWRACKEGKCNCGMIWDVTGNCLVAVVQGPMHMEDLQGPDGVPGDDEQEANARLIAAAPDMAEVLENVQIVTVQDDVYISVSVPGRGFWSVKMGLGSDLALEWGRTRDAVLAKARGETR